MKQHTTTARVHVRRGNTLILVAGVLALLTIIASVFITRTKGTRDSAAAVQKTMMNQTRVDHIAEMLAEEVTQALFVEPFVPLFVHNRADSNWSRQRTESAQYVGTLVHERNGWDPSNPFNFAPHRVVPWTNWPDEGSTNDTGTLPGFWPHDDDGAPSPFGQPFTLNEANPFGNPGVSDCRWLRDTEPLRWDTNSTADFVPDAFKYWRHLTNISRANNGWRVCRDISDISGAGLVTNLNSPIEQWLVDRQPSANNFDATTGDAVFSNEGQFMGLWNAWLNNDLAVHALAFPYHQPSWIPPNLYNLWNLDGGIDGDGDGVDIDDYERPAAEFISGTARWNVGRV
ncbi:MAG: hypothetical protein GY716_13095, partial [bacterium]|nr:hypothetical protein [bacterium]